MHTAQQSPHAGIAPQHRALIALAALLAVVAVVVVLLVADLGGGEGGSGSPTVASQAELAALTSRTGLPTFWAGSQPATTYELTTSGEGREYVRYIPAGSHGSEAKAKLLTVGTYRVENALRAVRAIAAQPGSTAFAVPGGGLAAHTRATPTNVYLAYPGYPVEVEVFSPNGEEASELVQEGKVEPIAPQGAIATSPAGPRIVSPAGLRSFANRNPFAVYWAGRRAGRRLELTRTIDGRVYVRYLPLGVRAGDPRPAYLTVGTYPVGNGSTAISRAGHTKGVTTLRLPDGTVVVYRASKPASAYFATPGSGEEVEVYSPQPGGAVALLAAGRIVPVG